MGIFCKIGVVETPNHEFTPGSVVSGSIKYAFDKNTVAKRITVSLKGRGQLEIFKTTAVNNNHMMTAHSDKEKYVSLEKVILDDTEGKQFKSGEYETPFSFQLPEDIPASLKYYDYGSYEVSCKIAYYIKIKFEVAGFLKFNKTFQKEIKVVPAITPKLSPEPIIYGDRKEFFQPFKKNKGVLHLKACIKCSVLEPGGKIEIAYELLNDSNKTVQAIETKLVTVYKFFYNKDVSVKNLHDVKNTDSKTTGIKKGSTEQSSLEIEIPSDLYCIENSKLVSREYAVLVTVCLPLPQKNMQLEIPVQVGNILVKQPIVTIGSSSVEQEEPPSYWETMHVCDEKTDVNFFNDVKNKNI